MYLGTQKAQAASKFKVLGKLRVFWMSPAFKGPVLEKITQQEAPV